MPSAPDIDTILDNAEAQLDTIRKEAGKILRRPTNAIFEEDFTENFIDDDGVLRVTLLFDPITREREDEATRKYWLSHEFDMVHYLMHNDKENSARGFRLELEAIRNLFRGNSTIFSVPHLPEHQRTITETSSDIVMFGDALAHEGRMRFVIEGSEVVT